MLAKLYIRLTLKISQWKQENQMYQTTKFSCDDCHKKGLVLRQISVLNLAFWFLLGVASLFILRACSATWLSSATIGFLIWFVTTGINVKLVKPQCRHCRSVNVRKPTPVNQNKADVYASSVEPE